MGFFKFEKISTISEKYHKKILLWLIENYKNLGDELLWNISKFKRLDREVALKLINRRLG